MTSQAINQVQVADRHRKDLGDLSDLLVSIENVGLLHPIVVTPDGRLIAGQRRLEACRQLGWTEVPTRVATHLAEARQWLEAERDENVCRLDMRPSEKVALGLALEELERPAAEARRRATQNNTSSENFTEQGPKGETREIVGSAVGMSGPTYQRAKAVVGAAESGNAIAQEAVAEMDATGKVLPAFEKVMGRAANGSVTRDGSRKRSSEELVTRVLSKLVPTVAALKHFDWNSAITPDAPLGEWDKQLTEDIIVPLSQLRAGIRKGSL